jgi:hypothetical protein
MATKLSPFFTKHHQDFTPLNAVKIIDAKVDEAKHDLKKYPNESDYLKHLAEAHTMISDFFIAMEIDPKRLT